MVEQDELELDFPGFYDFWRMGEDLHPVLSGGETGRQKFGLPFLLNHAEAAGTERNEPSVVTERGDPDRGRLGRLKNRPAPLDLHFDTVNCQFDGLVRHTPNENNQSPNTNDQIITSNQ
jgi:hypothetical protein